MSVRQLDREVKAGRISTSKPAGRRWFLLEDLAAYEMGRGRREAAAPGQFAADLVSEQRQKAMQRFLLPLVKELWGSEVQDLVRRIEALERGGVVPRSQMEVAA